MKVDCRTELIKLILRQAVKTESQVTFFISGYFGSLVKISFIS